MPRKKPEQSGTTWADIAECVPSWEKDAGVRVVATIAFEPHLSDGARVEVVLLAGSRLDARKELCRVRAPFPVKRSSGQAGAVLHAIFQAFAEYESNPWLWTDAKRKAARGE